MNVYVAGDKLVIQADDGKSGYWLGWLAAELTREGWKYSHADDPDGLAELFLPLVKSEPEDEPESAA